MTENKMEEYLTADSVRERAKQNKKCKELESRKEIEEIILEIDTAINTRIECNPDATCITWTHSSQDDSIIKEVMSHYVSKGFTTTRAPRARCLTSVPKTIIGWEVRD